jgi:hypothetical protein
LRWVDVPRHEQLSQVASLVGNALRVVEAKLSAACADNRMRFR